MRMFVSSSFVPRWVALILVLIAIVLIPFALMLALILGGLALGVSVLRFFLFGAAPDDPGRELRRNAESRYLSDSSAIDADFEVKSEKEKGNGP